MSDSFWSGYRKSLKPLDVEEPIDVWVHRPLAYLLARAAFPTPISPNAITFSSILCGIAALGFLLRGQLPVAGLLVFLSAVLDCADGQLARLRGTSSAFGRMLDGLADFVVTIATVGGGIYLVWLKFGDTLAIGIAMLAMCAATAATGSFHTSMYDHYKNVFLRMTSTKFQEGEDVRVAEARFAAQATGRTLFMKLTWAVYLYYLRSQLNFAKWFDPYLGVGLSRLPPYEESRARIYREKSASSMRLWRSFFGFGSLMFGLAVSIGFNVVEWYMVGRLVLLNGLFFIYLRPLQRRVSRQLTESLMPAIPSLPTAD